MSLLYLDANALVKRYVHEPGSTWVRTLIDDPANVILISAISLVEVSAAIAICVRIGKLGPRQGGMAYEEFSGDKQALDAATAEGLPVENPFDHTDLNSPLGREL